METLGFSCRPSLVTFFVRLCVSEGRFVTSGLVVAGIIWAGFRRGPTSLRISGLLVGTFLATPYAFVYDMPMVTNAIVAVMHDEARMHRLLPIPEAFILVWALILPLLMEETWRPGAIRSIPLILLFGLIVWHTVTAGRRIAGALGPGADPSEA